MFSHRQKKLYQFSLFPDAAPKAKPGPKPDPKPGPKPDPKADPGAEPGPKPAAGLINYRPKFIKSSLIKAIPENSKPGKRFSKVCFRCHQNIANNKLQTFILGERKGKEMTSVLLANKG